MHTSDLRDHPSTPLDAMIRSPVRKPRCLSFGFPPPLPSLSQRNSRTTGGERQRERCPPSTCGSLSEHKHGGCVTHHKTRPWVRVHMHRSANGTVPHQVPGGVVRRVILARYKPVFFSFFLYERSRKGITTPLSVCAIWGGGGIHPPRLYPSLITTCTWAHSMLFDPRWARPPAYTKESAHVPWWRIYLSWRAPAFHYLMRGAAPVRRGIGYYYLYRFVG